MSRRLLPPILLGLSLIANAFCIAAWWRADRPAAPSPTPAAHQAPARALARAQPTFDAQTWAKLKQDDLRDYAARLRQAGFPADITRALILLQLSETNAVRRRALLGTPDAVNYWKQARRNPADDKAIRELRREEGRLLREALGADAEPEDAYHREASGLSILSAEKAELVRQLSRQRDEKREDLSAASGYNYEDTVALDREFQNALRRTLTPKEFLEFELRTSSRARSLREQLAGGEVTEEEFRSIYGMKTAFDEQFEASLTSRDASQLATRQEAATALREQIRLQLGPERATEFERMENYDYRRTTEVIARLDLPRETSAQISTVQDEITRRRAELVRANTIGTLSREAMLTQMQELQKEATSRLTPLLRGSRGFEAYRQYAGDWIGNLVPVR